MDAKELWAYYASQVYQKVNFCMADKPVIIRTLDVGGEGEIRISICGREPYRAIKAA